MHFKISSAICFNLELSKILLSGNGLNCPNLASTCGSVGLSEACIRRLNTVPACTAPCNVTTPVLALIEVIARTSVGDREPDKTVAFCMENVTSPLPSKSGSVADIA